MPPSMSGVPVAASTSTAYVLSFLGYAMIGSVINRFLKMWKALRASPVIGPLTYGESFLVALFKGSQILLKSLIWVLKKLHNPTKDLISDLEVGILAFSTAFSLSLPGIIPSGVSLKPRYATSLQPKKHFAILILRLCSSSLVSV